MYGRFLHRNLARGDVVCATSGKALVSIAERHVRSDLEQSAGHGLSEFFALMHLTYSL